ncbi:ImmA/IrrE family metallo-endopeptidase [Actinomyces sp. 2119]|uniref:ImmA/IrrE family metallo-endopeptidase n=1 Tax=Actinomyces lilanjuaniae TaxID=2321394 RepID=A0ABM6Z4T5_9ACTO|nr:MULTISPECIES: ImmA/IrrE family metallo-endopeptidase [Actinomyces]AYD90328.1 ImmA/IrrE family metallo-endopeptidase [Actinomyces lilanjuaniae]RJF40897.1 ImmA/IrrE family metallo-endopeptidase [Actinomyces sp. 2119]
MAVVRVDIAPDVLRWAVRRARWDEDTVRHRAPKLDEWIDGSVRPTLKQMEKLAADTHTPFGMLFLPEPPVEDVPVPDMRTPRDAGVREPSADLLETIYLCQRRQDWYRDEALEDGAAPLGLVGSATLTTPVDDAADRIRTALRLDERSVTSWSDAMTDLIERAETIGVLVMVNGVVGSDTHRRLDPEEFRGFALADDVAPLVFVNGADTKAAQVFTLVHELAHLWLGHSALSDADAGGTQGEKREERWCNQVAAQVLIPLDSLREGWAGDCGQDELNRLASHYKVSTLVVLARLRDAGFLTWDEYMARYDAERQRVMGLMQAGRDRGGGGNYYHTQLRRLGRAFTRAVVSSTLEGRTTYRDAYRLLGTVKHSTFEGLAEKVGIT